MLVRTKTIAPFSGTRLLEEVEHLPGAALGLILEEEMPNAIQQHQLRSGDLAREAGRVFGRDVLVALAIAIHSMSGKNPVLVITRPATASG